MTRLWLAVSPVALGVSCALLLAAEGTAAPAPPAPGGLSIGWASQDVTPTRPVMLYGQLETRVSKEVKDPVTVTALAIEAPGPDKGADQAILVSCDLEYVPPLIQKRVREGFHGQVPDFDVRKLFMNATHTHTAPVCLEGQYWPLPGAEAMAPAAYAEFFVGRAVEAAAAAWKGRKPAAVGWALTKAVIGHCRIRAILRGRSSSSRPLVSTIQIVPSAVRMMKSGM